MEPRSRRGPCAPAEAPEAASVWSSELPDASQVGSEMRLAMASQGGLIPNHQLCGRPTIRGEVSLYC
jgi:hypothetical protein